MRHDVAIALLTRHGIQPSAQRVAVADYVLYTDEHPLRGSRVRQGQEVAAGSSRATVYNTLNLRVKKGLLRELVLSEGKIVFDPKLERHHHFVDDQTGRISDVPWDALEVKKVATLDEFDVAEYQVDAARPAPRLA